MADLRTEVGRHTVLLSRGRGTFVQDVVLTFRQMPGGWPSYEKGTATTAYPNAHSFEKSFREDLAAVGKFYNGLLNNSSVPASWYG